MYSLNRLVQVKLVIVMDIALLYITVAALAVFGLFSETRGTQLLLCKSRLGAELVIPMVNPLCVVTTAKSVYENALGVVFNSSPGVSLLSATDGWNSAETHFSVNSCYMLSAARFNKVQSTCQSSECMHLWRKCPKRDRECAFDLNQSAGSFY